MFSIKHGFFMGVQFLLISFSILLSSCSSPQPKSGFESYESLKVHTKNYQASLQQEYKKGNDLQKKKIITGAKDSILKLIINEYFNYWKGTAWDFNGTTKEPKKGKIACGYFVTTVLQDAGFDIPRVKWAQVASETMIKAMTKDIKRYSNKPVSIIEKYIKQKGKGLYVVGLDSHTGFIFNDGEKVRFVHSNYYKADIGVMEQELDSNNPLKDSKYRVIGKILDDKMMEKWVLGKKI